MLTVNRSRILFLGLGLVMGAGTVSAKPKPASSAVPLNAAREKLEAQYASAHKGLQAEITKALPAVSGQKKAALDKAGEEAKKALAQARGTSPSYR